MSAQALTDLLLEANILNPKDYERRVDILAADINDERMAAWFTRTVKFMIQNMDQLTTRSYRPEPKPRYNITGVHGTSNPFVEVDPEDLPVERGSKDLLTMLTQRSGNITKPTWFSKEPPTSKTVELGYQNPPTEDEQRNLQMRMQAAGRNQPISQADWDRWQSQRGSFEREQAERFRNAPKYTPPAAKAKRAKKAKRAVAEALLETDPSALVGGSFKALKTAVDRKEEPDVVERALYAFMSENGIDAEDVNGALNSHRPGETLAELVRGLTDRPPQVVVQALRSAGEQLTAYSTKLHQEPWRRTMTQEFKPFTKGSGRDLPFSEPAETPEWMAKQQASGKSPEALFFDPLRINSRPFWSNLEALVSYLNYMALAAVELADSENEEERADSEKGRQLLATLDKGKAADIDLFLNLLSAAKEFEDNIPNILLRHSAKIIAQYDNLKLYQLTSAEAVHDFSNRQTTFRQSPEKRNSAGQPVADWCTKDLGNAKSYLGYGDGVMYQVWKDEQPYVQICAGSGSQQVKDVYNRMINDQIFTEILPVLTALPDHVLKRMETPNTLERVRRYQAEQRQRR